MPPLDLNTAIEQIIKTITQLEDANDVLNAFSISLGSFVASLDGDHNSILDATLAHTKTIAAKVSAKGTELAQEENTPLVSLE